MKSPEQRLTDLEIQISFAEDLLDSLNALVARQQEQIERLVQEVADLKRQRAEDSPMGFRSLREELPPHY